MSHLRFIAASLLCGIALFGIACRKVPPTSRPAATETTRPIQNPTQVFDGSAKGFTIAVPAGWTPEPSSDFVLSLRPSTVDDGRRLSVDVPDLPPHIPGMIPLGLVVDGYVDELEKNHPGAVTEFGVPPLYKGIGIVDRRREATTRWQQHGSPWTETALIMVRKDRVYIIRSTSLQASEATTRAAWNDLLSTFQWTERP